jgi:hypothetical protein
MGRISFLEALVAFMLLALQVVAAIDSECSACLVVAVRAHALLCQNASLLKAYPQRARSPSI